MAVVRTMNNSSRRSRIASPSVRSLPMRLGPGVVMVLAIGLLAACTTPDEGDVTGAPPTSAVSSAPTTQTSTSAESVPAGTPAPQPTEQHAASPAVRPPTPTRTPAHTPTPTRRTIVAKPSPTAARPVRASTPTPTPCRAASTTASVAAVRNMGRNADGDWFYATDFVLANTSPTSCAISGWVGFDMRGSSTATTCIEADPPGAQPTSSPCPSGTGIYADMDSERGEATHVGGPPSVVVLPSNTSTQFSAIWTGVICLSAPYHVDLRLPGDPTPINVIKPMLCITDAGVQITPVGQTQPSPSPVAS